MNGNWLKAQEVAGRLGVAVTTVYALCQTRQVAHIRVGSGRGAIRISEAALQDYIRTAAVPADAPAGNPGGGQ